MEVDGIEQKAGWDVLISTDRMQLAVKEHQGQLADIGALGQWPLKRCMQCLGCVCDITIMSLWCSSKLDYAYLAQLSWIMWLLWRLVFTHAMLASTDISCCCVSFCLSLCPSVTSWCSTETAKYRINGSCKHSSPGTLVFWCRRSRQNSYGVTPSRGAKCRWG